MWSFLDRSRCRTLPCTRPQGRSYLLAPDRYFGQGCNIVNRIEVAVVGAGVTGLAVARELESRGLAVAVVEREGIGARASGVQPGGVRQQWGTRVACRLARESIEFWRDIDARLGARVDLSF